MPPTDATIPASGPLTLEQIEEAIAQNALSTSLLRVDRSPPNTLQPAGDKTLVALAFAAVDKMFENAHMSPAEFPKTRNKCAEAVVETEVFLCPTLWQWYGEDELRSKISLIEDEYERLSDGKMIQAPIIVAAMVMKHIRFWGVDYYKTGAMLRKLSKYIGVAIQVYERHPDVVSFKVIEEFARTGIRASKRVKDIGRGHEWVVLVPPLDNGLGRLFGNPEFEYHKSSEPNKSASSSITITDNDRLDSSIINSPTITRSQTRQEAIESAGDLLTLIGKRREPQEVLKGLVKKWLTRWRYRVLPEQLKSNVYNFCIQFWPEFLEEITEDDEEDCETSRYEVLSWEWELKEPVQRLQAIADGMRATDPSSAKEIDNVCADVMKNNERIGIAVKRIMETSGPEIVERTTTESSSQGDPTQTSLKRRRAD